MKCINTSFRKGCLNNNLYNGTSSRAPVSTIQSRFPDLESKIKFFHSMGASATSVIKNNGYIGQSCIDSEFGKKRFNRCSHISYTGVQLPYGHWVKDALPTSTYGSYAGFRKAAMTGSPVTKIPHLSLLTQFASNRAWWTMQPRFEGQISMINFLIELKDVKRLLGHAYSLFKALKNLRKLLYRVSRSPKFDPTKPIASVYLEAEFGIKPLIRDLCTIWGQLGEKVQQAQEEFRNRGLQDGGVTSHYSEVLGSSSTLTPGTNNNYFYGYGESISTKFCATLNYSYDYKLRDGFDSFMKYWGLEGSIGALWEAIPFSFLADYFVKIQKAIHAMEIDPNVKVFESKYCESIKTTHTSGTHLRGDSRVLTYIIDGFEAQGGGLVSGYSGTNYYRYPAQPNKGLYIPQISSEITNKQATNVAAVLRTLI